MDTQSPPPSLPTAQAPQRHGCLITWLVFMIIANIATAVITPASIEGMKRAGLHPSPVGIGIIVICALANVAFAIALFRWYRWGFYSFLVTSAIALIVNLSMGLGIAQCLFGLVGIALLYWVLNMGGQNKAWPRLK